MPFCKGKILVLLFSSSPSFENSARISLKASRALSISGHITYQSSIYIPDSGKCSFSPAKCMMEHT